MKCSGSSNATYTLFRNNHLIKIPINCAFNLNLVILRFDRKKKFRLFCIASQLDLYRRLSVTYTNKFFEKISYCAQPEPASQQAYVLCFVYMWTLSFTTSLNDYTSSVCFECIIPEYAYLKTENFLVIHKTGIRNVYSPGERAPTSHAVLRPCECVCLYVRER